MAQRKNDKKSRFFNKFRNKLRLFFSMNSMWFFIFAVLSLVIPDLVLKSRVIFVDFRVDEGPLLRFLLCDFIPLLFTALWVCLILFICVYMLPKRYGRLLFILIATLSNVLMISEFIYYTMFGRFFMLNSIFLATEGAAYIPILHQYISGQLILWTILSITSLVMACILWKKYTIPKKFWSIGLIFPVAILSLSLSMTVSDAEKTDTEIWSTWKRPRFVYSDMADPDRCMRVMGIYQFMARSVTYPLFYDSGFTDEDYDRVAKYIEERNDFFDTHPAENEMTGYFKDKNVEIVYFPYTQGTSSTQLRTALTKKQGEK